MRVFCVRVYSSQCLAKIPFRQQDHLLTALRRWSEDRLRELLGAVDLNRELDRVKITEVEKLKGEAIVNNRKAKLIYLYDWTITGKWQGYMKQVGIRH